MSALILNITPDHLNRHGTMENYIEVKERVAVNQTEDDCIVLNYDDKGTARVWREEGSETEGHLLLQHPDLKRGHVLRRHDMMIYAHDGKRRGSLKRKDGYAASRQAQSRECHGSVAMSIRHGRADGPDPKSSKGI